MIFYGYFLIYMIIGLVITASLFYWAVTRGQFRDQRRIRYAPLAGEAPIPVDATTAKWPRSMILTVIVGVSGVVSLVTCVIISVWLD
jgi:hypothetical protein